ncbi:hypothetical protein [Pedobacter terrae]|uniref:hypothetical protein n=1 Tax=Pedobacter terrae TaxID=405671 RepID=UPI002FF9BCC8
MNENNAEYLQNTLKYLGFGESLSEQLKEAIKKQLPEFSLNFNIVQYTTNAKDKPELANALSYVLDFSKSRETDMYFFNKYHVSLEKPGLDNKLEQTFYINKGKGVTVKESYNLLSGRAVNKDVILKSGEKANLWLKLNFSEHTPEKGYSVNSYGENYGFNLKQTVDKFNILDMEKPGFKDQLLKSLERGNLHEVSFMKNGKEAAGFVAANPQYKTLDFYDKDLSLVYSKAVDLREPFVKATQPNEVNVSVVEEASEEAKMGRAR